MFGSSKGMVGRRAQIIDVAYCSFDPDCLGLKPGKLLVPCHAKLGLSFAQRSLQERNGVGRKTGVIFIFILICLCPFSHRPLPFISILSSLPVWGLIGRIQRSWNKTKLGRL